MKGKEWAIVIIVVIVVAVVASLITASITGNIIKVTPATTGYTVYTTADFANDRVPIKSCSGDSVCEVNNTLGSRQPGLNLVANSISSVININSQSGKVNINPLAQRSDLGLFVCINSAGYLYKNPSPCDGQSGGGCTDSDGGVNFNVQGTVTIGGQSYTDVCSTSNLVTEYYCNATSPVGYSASTGYCGSGCFNGACQ